MELSQRAQQFPLDGYLTVGNPRRSSWVDGHEKALAFFWRPPGSQASKLVRTQAPYIVRIIQRYFGTGVDGIFGDATRTAIENHARRSGLNVPPNWTAGPQLLGYALSNALLGGGEVIFPARNDFPNTNRPSRAPSPGGRELSYVGVLDLDTGREEPLNVPLPTATQQPGAQQQFAAPPPATQQQMVPMQQQPGAQQQFTAPPPVTQQQPGTQQQFTAPPPVTQQPVHFLNDPSGNTFAVFQGVLYLIPPEIVMQLRAGVQVDLNAVLGLVAPTAVGQPCPKEFINENGVCKLSGYGTVAGARMAVPNKHGIVVDFANPATYRNADVTPGVVLTGLIGSASVLLGAVLK